MVNAPIRKMIGPSERGIKQKKEFAPKSALELVETITQKSRQLLAKKPEQVDAHLNETLKIVERTLGGTGGRGILHVVKSDRERMLVQNGLKEWMKVMASEKYPASHKTNQKIVCMVLGKEYEKFMK